MIIHINNQRYSLQDIKTGKSTENYSGSKLAALKLVKEWLSGSKNFNINTSGSTGKPKAIKLSREVLHYSARETMNLLDAENSFRNALLCINPEYIGGKMMIIRSLINELDLTIVDPKANPFEHLRDTSFDLVSMVPLQVETVLMESSECLKAIKALIIGGAPLTPDLIQKLNEHQVNAFHSYGMTETASHIALDDLNNPERVFKTMGDVEIKTDKRGCLKIKGTVTNQKWLQTNDVVQILNDHEFVWLGRADFMINSGGYKVHPEKVESLLKTRMDKNLMVIGLPHHKLGEEVTILIEGNEETFSDEIFDGLHPYERPKNIIFVPEFQYTQSGKIDRLSTKRSLKNE